MRIHDNGRLIDGIREKNNSCLNIINNHQNNFNNNNKIEIIPHKNENHSIENSIFNKNIDNLKEDIIMKDVMKKKSNK
jgi:hypothetical protein